MARTRARTSRRGRYRTGRSVVINPRTPVVVGVGEVDQRVGPLDAREPIALFADAVRAADADTGRPGALLSRVDTAAAVQIVSWPYADAGARVSHELGIDPRRTV